MGGGVDFELELPADAVFRADMPTEMISMESGVVVPPGGYFLLSVGHDGGFRPLARERFFAEHKTKGEWRPLEVDLSAYAGQKITLRLELTPDTVYAHRITNEGHGLRMFGWVGSPHIAAPGEPVR
jgi:hypothetical protein